MNPDQKIQIRTEISKRDNSLLEIYRIDKDFTKAEIIRQAIQEFIEHHSESIQQNLEKEDLKIIKGGE